MTLDTHQLLTLIAGLVSGGIAVSLAAGVLKRLFKLSTDAVIHTMVVAISIAASAAQYLLQIHSQLPPAVLGVSSAAIYGVSQFVFKNYHYATDFLTKVKAYNDSNAAKKAADASVAAVDSSPMFDDENPTSGLIETGSGAPSTPKVVTATYTTAPAEFQA